METLPFVDSLNRAIVNPLITLLVALALVVFLFGVYEFIMGADNEDKRQQGRLHMFWGIVGLAIMITVFGIMKVICATVGGNCGG